MRRALSAAMLAALHVTLAVGQTADFSGTWRLDTERSRIAPAAGLAGLAGAGAPATLHVTQPANGTLVIESQVNEGHARLYLPGARIVTPVTVGPGGSVAMTARWDGRLLVSEGTRESSSGASTTVQQVKEVISVAADGATLAIDITVQGPEGTSTSALRYTRLLDVGPCNTWPTPCKVPNDLAFAAIPTLEKNPHNHLVRQNVAGAQGAISRAVQKQMVLFFVSDGMVVFNPDGDLGAFFQFPVFEVPIVPPLPEVLSFIP